MSPLLACPVRACGRPLRREGRQLSCSAGHSHDIARRGYINLLQPQDRRSATPGDTPAAVDARRRLAEAGLGVTRALANDVSAIAHALSARTIVDVGCGTGDFLSAVAALPPSPADAIGIDISVDAVGDAARRFPALTWVVANADRRLPLVDGGVDLVTSVHARRNADECARVMSPGARLVVAVPAEDDLAELRLAVHGEVTTRSRIEGVVADHAARFRVERQWTVRVRARVSAPLIPDVLLTSYRGQRRAVAERAAPLEALDVTFASDVVLLRR